mmetsp:Transcript_33516/g.104959  ORF Transcript_33516/g.104959 Transcript_33516/m.104959 type:complete len:281 (+) Transcript_33516:73-915(+)
MRTLLCRSASDPAADAEECTTQVGVRSHPDATWALPTPRTCTVGPGAVRRHLAFPCQAHFFGLVGIFSGLNVQPMWRCKTARQTFLSSSAVIDVWSTRSFRHCAGKRSRMDWQTSSKVSTSSTKARLSFTPRMMSARTPGETCMSLHSVELRGSGSTRLRLRLSRTNEFCESVSQRSSASRPPKSGMGACHCLASSRERLMRSKSGLAALAVLATGSSLERLHCLKNDSASSAFRSAIANRLPSCHAISTSDMGPRDTEQPASSLANFWPFTKRNLHAIV